MSKTVQTGRSPKTRSYMVKVEWLDDGQCFMATSDDIDSLVLQADNIAEMEEEMRDIIPVLLESNHGVSIDAESMTLEPGRDKKARVTIHDQPSEPEPVAFPCIKPIEKYQNYCVGMAAHASAEQAHYLVQPHHTREFYCPPWRGQNKGFTSASSNRRG